LLEPPTWRMGSRVAMTGTAAAGPAFLAFVSGEAVVAVGPAPFAQAGLSEATGEGPGSSAQCRHAPGHTAGQPMHSAEAARGKGEQIWGSMIKQTLKRRNPGFNESYYGFRSFGQLLEEAQARGILELELDEKSGGYIIKSCHAV